MMYREGNVLGPPHGTTPTCKYTIARYYNATRQNSSKYHRNSETKMLPRAKHNLILSQHELLILANTLIMLLQERPVSIPGPSILTGTSTNVPG